jgi:hypothetical protein
MDFLPCRRILALPFEADYRRLPSHLQHLSQIAVGCAYLTVPSSFLAITDEVIASRGHCAARGAAISLPLLRA